MNPIESISRVLTDALYSIAFVLDRVVYSFIPKLYRLIIYLANVDLFNSNSAVTALMNRVYILVGVFMLFKLAFSVVRYIVDPNAFSDQAKGFTNLVKRLLVALVLLVSIPWLFGKIYEVQGIILSTNIIPNLILGTSDGGESDIEESAKDIQFLIFGPFYSIKPVGSLSVCEPEPNDDFSLSNIIGTTDMALKDDGKCLENLAKIMDESDSVNATGVTIDNFFGENRDFSSLGVLISVYEENERVVNYLPIVSTLCGGYLVFLLLSFCIDVGARAIKLMFLQILSPIAVISSVDPTSSSQSDKLKDWGKECLSTFASLFLRLAVIYLVIQLIKIITAKLFAGADLYNEAFRDSADTSLNIFVYIFLILGAFQVAKKIPDLIEKATGLKMSGELNLNPFKNPAIAGMTGMGVGAAVGGLAGFRAGIEAGAPVRGVLGGIATGMGKGREEKLGVGMAGNIRRKTYKDMTGSELSTFNPWQKLYGIGGQQKVDNTKKHIDRGRDMLNRVHSQLNAVSHMNAQRYTFLSNSGYDLSDSGTRNKFESLMKIEENDESYKSQIADLRKQKSDLRKQGFSINSQQVRDIDARLAKAMSLEQKAYNDFITNMNNMGISRDVYDSGKQYIEGLEQEDNLRAEIGQLEKSISTLDDQKRQQEQFYHIDSSPKESVEKALGTISDFGKKYPDKNNK